MCIFVETRREKREYEGKVGCACGGDYEKGFNERQLFVQLEQEHFWPFDPQEGPSEVGNCGGHVS